jgi:hypothetical protein
MSLLYVSIDLVQKFKFEDLFQRPEGTLLLLQSLCAIKFITKINLKSK